MKEFHSPRSWIKFSLQSLWFPFLLPGQISILCVRPSVRPLSASTSQRKTEESAPPLVSAREELNTILFFIAPDELQTRDFPAYVIRGRSGRRKRRGCGQCNNWKCKMKWRMPVARPPPPLFPLRRCLKGSSVVFMFPACFEHYHPPKIARLLRSSPIYFPRNSLHLLSLLLLLIRVSTEESLSCRNHKWLILA